MTARGGLEHFATRTWQRRGPAACLLLPLSALFAVIVGLRRLLFRSGVLRASRVGVPVIVVGNITVGGSGKTPFVIWLVDALRRRGFRPGVISRGYGRESDEIAEVFADSEPQAVGDEPLLIARRTAAPVFVGRDRVAAARALLAAHPACNLIVSDDGLQHYRLARDVELVVFDARGAGNGWLLPAGPLREPLARAHAAHAVIANGDLPPRLRVRLASRPLYAMALAGAALTRLSDGHVAGVETLQGRPLHAVAGIGNPQRFFEQLREAGLDVEAHAFPDHHAYRPADLDFGDGRAVLMTEKDGVKCAAFARQSGVDLWALRVDARLSPDPLPHLEKLLETAHGSAPA